MCRAKYWPVMELRRLVEKLGEGLSEEGLILLLQSLLSLVLD